MTWPCCTPVGPSLSRPGPGQDSQHLHPMRQRGGGRRRRQQRSNQAALERTAGQDSSASRILDWVVNPHSCYRPSQPQRTAHPESNLDWLGGSGTTRRGAAAVTAHASHPRSWHRRMLSPWQWPRHCQGEVIPRHHAVLRAPGCPSTCHQKRAAVLGRRTSYIPLVLNCPAISPSAVTPGICINWHDGRGILGSEGCKSRCKRAILHKPLAIFYAPE
jgi:hypothetical protein